MPRKSDSIPIKNKELDKRVKLSDSEKEDIRALAGKVSTYELARRYNVSRRTIQFVIDPSRIEENKKRRAERGGSMVYYNRAKNSESIKKHREYKKKLYEEGKIK